MSGIVHIPNPCHENWQAMHPKANGRLCDACCKVVVDFTTSTNEEIIDYLKASTNDRVCGRFKSSQVKTATPSLHSLPMQKVNLGTLQRFAAALFLVFGSLLFTACGDEHKVGEIITSTNRISTHHYSTAKVDPITSVSQKPVECVVVDDEHSIIGEIPFLPEEVMMGKVIIEQPQQPQVNNMDKTQEELNNK